MPSEFGFHNIIEGDGLGIAIAGLAIVFSALGLIATFIALLPRVLSRLAGILPPEKPRHAPVSNNSHDDEAVAVALAFALRNRGNRGSGKTVRTS